VTVVDSALGPLPEFGNMPKYAVGRRGAFAVAVVASVAAASAAISHFVLPPLHCERCGADMRPYRCDDFDWAGTSIYECRHCGFMVDQDAWSFAQRLWADDIPADARPRS